MDEGWQQQRLTNFKSFILSDQFFCHGSWRQNLQNRWICFLRVADVNPLQFGNTSQDGAVGHVSIKTSQTNHVVHVNTLRALEEGLWTQFR